MEKVIFKKYPDIIFNVISKTEDESEYKLSCTDFNNQMLFEYLYKEYSLLTIQNNNLIYYISEIKSVDNYKDIIFYLTIKCYS